MLPDDAVNAYGTPEAHGPTLLEYAYRVALQAFVLKEAEIHGWAVDENHMAERSALWREEVEAAISAALRVLSTGERVA